MFISKWLDAITGTKAKKVVHRGHSATERQIGTIYDGWRIVERIEIPQYLRWLHDGKRWAFVGEKGRLGRIVH